jgi:hypothetical protein
MTYGPGYGMNPSVPSGICVTSQLVWDRCETWYQWMVARLFYTNPSVRAYDLSIHAQQAVDRYLQPQSDKNIALLYSVDFL